MKTLSVSQFKATMARRLREVQSGDDPVQRPPLHVFDPPPVAAVPSFRGPVFDLLAQERAASLGFQTPLLETQ